MDLDKFQELTGTTVAEGDKARYNAVIRRTTTKLESALGYSLAPRKNLDKQELGKVQYQGLYPYYPVNTDNLLPADEQEGTYRLFPYNENDIYLKTDPYSNLYHVKLVQPVNDDEFVTYTDLDFVSKNARKFVKFIQKMDTWFTWGWYTWLLGHLGTDNGLMLAVDADWLDCTNIPADLLDLWTDMVTYYADENYSVSGSIKSESVNGHSWSRSNAGGGKGVDLAPQDSTEGVKTIAQYAGPNGTSAARIPV